MKIFNIKTLTIMSFLLSFTGYAVGLFIMWVEPNISNLGLLIFTGITFLLNAMVMGFKKLSDDISKKDNHENS